MTRKKYVKQLMALGFSRNEANRSANVARVVTTYERALEIEKGSVAFQKAAVHFSTTLLDTLAPAIKAIGELADQLREKFKDVQWPSILPIDWAAENALMAPDPQWPKRNPTRNDIVDALVYGVDLAAGPDMTAYKPIIRPGAVVINAEPVLDLTRKTATELADEIAEKLQPPGGGGNGQRHFIGH